MTERLQSTSAARSAGGLDRPVLNCMSGAGPWPRWERVLLGVVLIAALVLGASRLGGPGLWHDELVHLFAAKRMAEEGSLAWPNGQVVGSGITYNACLAAVVFAVGDSETAARMPSVVFHAVAVFLTYLLLRRLLGRGPALAATFMLALSPWSVAWSRQAKPYAFQEMLYLAFLWTVLRTVESKARWQTIRWAVVGIVVYIVAIYALFHSILFAVGPGIAAFLFALREGRWKTRWAGLWLGLVLLCAGTVIVWRLTFSWVESHAVFTGAGLGGKMVEPGRVDRLFYLRWLWLNLSLGYFLLAMAGFVAMLREGRRGVFTALAFWGPLLVLTFLVGYRRPRFIFFAYPFYAAACGYGLVAIIRFLKTYRQARWRLVVAGVLLLFLARLATSSLALLGDSMDTAAGAKLTLARLHPDWRTPARYVKEHRDGEVVISTTGLPAVYYVGEVQGYFPDYVLEQIASPVPPIGDLAALQEYVRAHPKGYFLAHRWRFENQTEALEKEIDWVATHMTRIEEGSSEEVTLFHWDFTQSRESD